MKKICFSVLMILLLFLHIPDASAACLDFDGRYSFYAEQPCEAANCDVTDAGIFYIYSCDASFADGVKRALDSVVGESVTFYGDKADFSAAVRSLGQTLFFYRLGDTVVAEGFSPYLPYGVQKQGLTVNFQAALSDNKITVGTPLIMGAW